jgi:hypothetical protein
VLEAVVALVQELEVELVSEEAVVALEVVPVLDLEEVAVKLKLLHQDQHLVEAEVEEIQWMSLQKDSLQEELPKEVTIIKSFGSFFNNAHSLSTII